jgi:alkane 1-monooxygenase
MTTTAHSRYTLNVKKYGYLLFLLPLSMPPAAVWIGGATGLWDVAAFYTPFWYFVLIPLIDWAIGPDPANPAEADVGWLADDRFYRVLTLACLPLFAALLLWGAWVFATAPFSWVGMLGWVVSIGCVGGVAAINTGHELIHKGGRLEPWAGGALLSLVSYGTFKVEHIYGHHVLVATPHDGSSAVQGQSVYAFIARALRDNPRRAFALQREARARRGLPVAWWRGELAVWSLLSLGWAAACALVVAAFSDAPWWLGVLYFAGQSLVAISLLEIINYVEHYGLTRRPLGAGRYERVDVTHSWNSNFAFTNLLLFQLQRHSDHHAHAARRYQALRHFDESPQLPAGYAAMVLLAVVPPLWRRVMDPRADSYEQGRARAAAAA